MKEKSISKISYILMSLLFLCVGITLICYNTSYVTLFHLLTSILIIALGCITLVLNLVKEFKLKDIAISLLTLIIGLFFFNNKAKFLSLFPIVFGLYMLLNGIIKIITYIVFKTQNKTNIGLLFGSIIDLIFSFIMITQPSKNIKTLTIILGIYLILFGITYLKDFIRECFPQKYNNKRGIRITLPVILSFLIPYTVLLKINKLLEDWKTPVNLDNKNTSGNVDLEILIHVKDTKIGRFGHADLCYKDKVYSYGCYDEESKKLFESLGSGTLFNVDGKEKYIKYCNTHSDKTIFCFGLTLSEKQKEKVENKIKEIESHLYKWDPKEKKKKKERKNSYANELVKETDAEFYKFNDTSYKTYFLLSTNCVKLVDDIVGVTGSDILKINGVITPGTYYEYLEREFKRKNSNVISKQIYTNK